MIHLLLDLKEKLILRKRNELKMLEELVPETDRDLMLISSGKIAELDVLIASMEDMIRYVEKTEKIYQ